MRGRNTYTVWCVVSGNAVDWDDHYPTLAARWRDVDEPNQYAIIESSDAGLALAAKDCSDL